jgi:hypothetical protein
MYILYYIRELFSQRELVQKRISLKRELVQKKN